uniref:Glycosyltransferase family 92 protein n=1 Tax=Plectus sambesii TaxID=2011161 RepID=A0A914VKC1_9BILA
MENWLLAGATKFFIYWQSVTQDVTNIFLYYKENGVDIELVAWPQLNDENADFAMYNSGQVVSINDCLHRARSHAEFAATVDLNELVVLSSSTPLVAILNGTQLNSAGRSITRAHAHFENNYIYASDPMLLSFDWLNETHFANVSSAQPKLILRPENVQRSSVHWINELEPLITTFTGIPHTEATLIHLRSMQEKMDKNIFVTNNILQETAKRMTDSWIRRLHASEKDVQKLRITRGNMEIAQLMEECLLDLKKKVHSMCFTASHCIHELSRNSSVLIDWQYPEKRWLEL